MRLTKYPQSCILLEKDGGGRLLLDAGTFLFHPGDGMEPPRLTVDNVAIPIVAPRRCTRVHDGPHAVRSAHVHG